MDVTKVNELLNERKNIIAQQREMNDRLYSKDGKIERDFTAEEQTKYDAMQTDVTRITAAVNRERSLDKAETDFKKVESESVRAALADPTSPEGLRATPEYRKAFVAMLRNGGEPPSEFRATLQKAVSTQGGYLVPIEFETKILLKLYDANIMRQICNVIRTTAQTNIPMEGNLPTFGWIDELGTYPATDATFGQSILGAWKLGGVVTVSEELLDDAFLDVGDYIAGRSALSAGFAEEAAYIAGDGNKKPTGALVSIAASGVNQTSAVSGKVNSVDMFTLKYGLPRPYRKGATFVVADTLISSLAQEKSTTGSYLWMPALTADAPDMYLGKPILTSDFLPAVSAGSVSAMFGNFDYYQIVDRVGWSMQKLIELYALQGQVGYKMHERTDGKLLRPEAIQTLTTHA